MASAVAFVAVVAAVLSVPVTVGAVERGDAVTAVTIEHGPNPVQYNSFQVHVDWEVPDGAAPGDTFTVGWNPDPAFQFFSATIDLVDDDGVSFGTCDVDAERMRCTFGENIARYDDVSGNAWFTASFARVQGPSTLTFELPNGTTFDVGTPPVGVRPAATMPTEPAKWGWFDSTREHIVWEITIPGSRLASDGDDVVITDEFGDNMTLVPASLQVGWMSAADYPTRSETASAWTPLVVGAGPETYAFTDRADDRAFDLTINEPVTDDGRAYRIRYRTSVPSVVANGDRFENVVRGLVGGTVRREIVYQAAGGGAGGATTTTSTTSTSSTSTSSTTSTSVPETPATTTTTSPRAAVDSSSSTGGTSTVRTGSAPERAAGATQSADRRALAFTGSGMALALLSVSMIAIGLGLVGSRRTARSGAD